MIKGNEYMIRCSRCGNEMKNTARYCIKCGNLNMDHPDNKNMKKYYKEQASEYVVSDNNVTKINEKSYEFNVKFTGIKICSYLNIILYLLAIGLPTIIYFKNASDLSMLSFVSSDMYFYYIVTSLYYLYLYAIELIYIKLGYSWWMSFIPILNVCLLSKRVFDNSLLGLVTFIPVVGAIYSLILMYRLGEMFDQNGLLFMLFPIVYIPKVGYGESLFNNNEFISDSKNYEKFYSYKKTFIILCSIVLVIGVLMLLFNCRYFFAI